MQGRLFLFESEGIMEQKKFKPEILAPAGSFESMVAAINAGADAIYIGGDKFGARAYANNLDENRMKEAIDYAHIHNCLIYLTINTLFKEKELQELFHYLKPFYEQGIDAVIVQDYGAFDFVRETFKDLPIHASTQMTITSVYGAELLKKMGASRIVTARELSLEEIQEIHNMVDIEIESFVHGALCYGYSGQCLFSSLIGGRSGNRGRCAQPCRLPYEVLQEQKILSGKNEKYILSPKDLCTLNLIPDLLEAGVSSLKIEGRMKSPRYTAGVVSIYRKYLDLYLKNGRKGYTVESSDRQMLLDLFDRGGFTEGYYKQHNEKHMIVMKEKPKFRQANQQLFDTIDETYVNKEKKEKVKGKVTIKKDFPATIELVCGDVKIYHKGILPEPSQKQPLTIEKLIKQIRKTGNTPFIFDTLEADLEDNLFISIQALNELRRDGLEVLKTAILKPYLRTSSILGGGIGAAKMDSCQEPKAVQINVLIEQSQYLEEVIKVPQVNCLYIDSNSFPPKEWSKVVRICHNAGKKCVLALPHIFRSDARDYFIRHTQELCKAEFDGLLVKNLEEVGFLEAHGIQLPVIMDHSIYAFNHKSIKLLYKTFSASKITLPLELNARELENLGCSGEELIVYGHLPMMVSAQCIHKSTDGCIMKTQFLTLKDRMGKDFLVKNNCTFCYNTIYNSVPMSLLTNTKEILRLSPSSIRLQFTIEPKELVGKQIQLFVDGFLNGKEVEDLMKDVTKGHFKRGVE